MSLQHEIQSSCEKATELHCDSKRHSKISYTRDFLLSLSVLDICKKLPSGFDQSLLSEFEDASHGILDRSRIPGSLPVQSFRRTEYTSSPPSRGDSSNYSRGMYGRWDNRSSGWGGRDSDSQSDRDSESGRRYGNPRQFWQRSEHDGLLGSGSFPRPSGHAAGLSGPKIRPNDHSLLNRSNEPYHPPRPYKAVPHSRKETKDSYNDETFGSTEHTSRDRAEEERKRRLSFELMRKEQQKTLKEKQKTNEDKHKDEHVSGVTELLEDAKNGTGDIDRSYQLDESVTPPVSNNDSCNSSLQNSASRQTAPPGFRSTFSERNASSESAIHSHSVKVGGPEIGENLSYTKTVGQMGTSDNQQEWHSDQKKDFQVNRHESTSSVPFLNKGVQVVASLADSEVFSKKLVDNQLHRTSSFSEASITLDGSEFIKLDAKKAPSNEIIGEPKLDNPASVLQKLFGRALTENISGSSGSKEHHDSEQDDTWSPNNVQSSKFAHWFLEDEKKAAEDTSYAQPSDLLSLIVGGEKGGSQVSHMKDTQHILSDLRLQNSESTHRNTPFSTFVNCEQSHIYGEQEAGPAILTCEDLEQKILSEYSGSSSALQAPVQRDHVAGEKTAELKTSLDNRASQQLLSMLQKEMGLKDIIHSPNPDGGFSDNKHVSEGPTFGDKSSRKEKDENIHNSGKTLTLETLFGSAFMNELQSVEAPVSVQKGSVGSARNEFSGQQGLSSGVTSNGPFPTLSVEMASSRSSHESSVLHPSQGQQTKSDKIENWLGFNGSQVARDPSQHQTHVVSKVGGFDRAANIQFQEENLVTVADPVNTYNFRLMSTGSSNTGELLSSNKPLNIVEKLAALNTVFKDQQSRIGIEAPPIIRRPYNLMEPEIPFRNFHAQSSAPQVHAPQMSHGRPFLHSLDSHPTYLNSQINSMAPEGNTHHGSSSNHQFSANMPQHTFQDYNTWQRDSELPFQHPLLQQMQTPDSFPLPHLPHKFPRCNPLPPYPTNQAAGFMQHHPMQSFAHRQPQPNFGGLGIPFPVHGGRNHPDAFQRLLEMELRANSSHAHPYTASGHNQPMQSHELDMGFRYR